MTAFLEQFEEIVLVDFEFNGRDGNRPNVVCLVAHELRSARCFQLRHNQLGPKPPYRIDSKTLVVAYYASAELTCHLALGWPLPSNILDLFIEFRRLTNHSAEKQPPARLLDALEFFKLDSIGLSSKEHWRDVILRGGPWSEEEWTGILDYCESDVEALKRLLPVMPIPNMGHSLIHGNYMRADAWMRHRGIPIDKPLFDNMSAHWTGLRQELINDLNTRYPFFDGPVFRKKLLEKWVTARGISFWPRTPTGQLSTDAETLRIIGQRCPEAAEFCISKITLRHARSRNTN
jgi:DNA polymerase-1